MIKYRFMWEHKEGYLIFLEVKKQVPPREIQALKVNRVLHAEQEVSMCVCVREYI